MFIIWLLYLWIFSIASFAELGKVHSVTKSFIKFEDGRVGFLDEIDINKLKKVQSGTLLNFYLDESNQISHIQVLDKSQTLETIVEPQQILPFLPSVLPSYSFATGLLRQFYAQDKEDSQCYDRAHVWTYFSFLKHDIHLPKMWLFFSDHYIEKYRFKWWFHVAPYALLRMREQTVERIMDRKFYSSPLKIKLWTDLFMENKASCKEVDLYTDYSHHPGEDDCYLIRSTPYFWQPMDLERYAKRGVEKRSYVYKEIKYSYFHAFDLEPDQTAFPNNELGLP